MTSGQVSPGALDVSESSVEDLRVLRYLLDLALQPIDDFRGFTHGEQLLLSALRYQLNGLCWALALSQRTRTPAFTGYLAEAQRNAITKMCDKRVWRYWWKENLIGYGRWDPDPIVHHNVMYSAYLGVMVGWYETLNHDPVFSRDGSLQLRWNDRTTFNYDFASLAEAIHRNMTEIPDAPQYPCEPHLVYPICNTYALNTLRMHDRLHGSDLTGDLVDRVRRSYDEQRWRRSDGRFYSGRTRRGRVPFLPPTLTNDAWMSYWLHGAMPDVARHTWEVVKDRHLHLDDDEVRLVDVPERHLDPGNYRVAQGGGPTYSIALKAARELGDEDIARGLGQMLERQYPFVIVDGAARHSGLSTLGNVLAAMGRFGGPDAGVSLTNGTLPREWATGPHLVAAAYPDVLVARAVTDGRRLDLVLRPGDARFSVTRLGIAQLVPGATYVVQGAEVVDVTADAEGRAEVPVLLSGRTEVAILPSQVASSAQREWG